MKSFTLSEAKRVGEKLGCDWEQWSVNDLKVGMDHELEHRDVTKGDPELTAKIAIAHLKEFPDYYDRLAEMEEAAEMEMPEGSQNRYKKTLY